MSEIITLYALGSLPGIPGEHAPGVYEVDWEQRTLTLVAALVPPPEPVADPAPEPEQPEQ